MALAPPGNPDRLTGWSRRTLAHGGALDMTTSAAVMTIGSDFSRTARRRIRRTVVGAPGWIRSCVSCVLAQFLQYPHSLCFGGDPVLPLLLVSVGGSQRVRFCD